MSKLSAVVSCLTVRMAEFNGLPKVLYRFPCLSTLHYVIPVFYKHLMWKLDVINVCCRLYKRETEFHEQSFDRASVKYGLALPKEVSINHRDVILYALANLLMSIEISCTIPWSGSCGPKVAYGTVPKKSISSALKTRVAFMLIFPSKMLSVIVSTLICLHTSTVASSAYNANHHTPQLGLADFRSLANISQDQDAIRVNTSNKIQIQCDGEKYGLNPNLADCQSARSYYKRSTERYTYGQRHSGHGADIFPLPYRTMGGKCNSTATSFLLDNRVPAKNSPQTRDAAIWNPS